MLQDSFNHGNTCFEGYELSKTMILDLSEVFEARQHRYWHRNPACDRSIFRRKAVGL